MTAPLYDVIDSTILAAIALRKSEERVPRTVSSVSRSMVFAGFFSDGPDRFESWPSTSLPRPAAAERATRGEVPFRRISTRSTLTLCMFALHPLDDPRIGSEMLEAHGPVEFVVLPLHGNDDVFHRQPLSSVFLAAGALQAGVKDDGVDVTTGQVELSREKIEIDLRGVHGFGHDLEPDLLPLLHTGRGEVDDETQPPQEGFVQILLPVGRQDGYALEPLHALQQIADLEVGIPVVGVFDLGPAAEEGIGFVKEEDDIGDVRRVEQTLQVL